MPPTKIAEQGLCGPGANFLWAFVEGVGGGIKSVPAGGGRWGGARRARMGGGGAGPYPAAGRAGGGGGGRGAAAGGWWAWRRVWSNSSGLDAGWQKGLTFTVQSDRFPGFGLEWVRASQVDGLSRFPESVSE